MNDIDWKNPYPSVRVPVFARLLEMAESSAYPIHWGAKGFSLNVDFDGTHAAFCYGYPPNATFKQSVYTAMVGSGGLISKLDASEEVVQSILEDARATGLFEPAGRELKCMVDRAFSTEEIDRLVAWCRTTADTIKEHGLRE